MDPIKQAELLDPLRRIANAVDRVGKGEQSGIYAGLRIDAPQDEVHVYVTDPSDAPELITAAQKADATVDPAKIVVEKVRYTLNALHDARSNLLSEANAKRLPYKIYSVAVDAETSSLDVAVNSPAKANASTFHALALAVDTSAKANASTVHASATVEVPLHFTQGQEITRSSWADTKWHDHSPFIGGDVITNGNSYCSAGLPAVRKSDNTRVMVTAGHCFSQSDRVYTGAGTTPSFGKFYDGLNGSEGDYVGTVSGISPSWDAEELIGADNNADASESSGYARVTSVAYSHNGDFVCQDGAASFFMQQGTVCGIEVINEDVTFTEDNGWSVRGVEGTRPNNPWTVAHGDSGSMVYATTGSTREARGVVSALSGPWQTHAGNYMYWTEATDIFNHFGLKLNPTT